MFGAKKYRLSRGVTVRALEKIVSTLAQPYQVPYRISYFGSKSNLGHFGAPHTQNVKIQVPKGTPLRMIF
jgi:hypothetical protein